MKIPFLMKDRASILAYHSIRKKDGDFWSVTPENFESQMAEIKANGRPVITLAELERRLTAGESLGGAVVLTFDDGYQDNLSAALPVLIRYGFPATIFITTGLIGTSDGRGMAHVSSGEMKTLQRSGLITLAPHSKTHPRLTTLPINEAREEIEGSRTALEAIIGECPPYFAYPYGGFDSHVIGLASALGFTLAVTTKGGTVGKCSDPLRLPRNEINAATNIAEFRRALSRAADIDGQRHEAWHRLRRLKTSIRKALMIDRVSRRVHWWADRHRYLFVARMTLRLLPQKGGTPTLLSDGEISARQAERRAERAVRLAELSYESMAAIDAERENLVSIGIFGCGRFNLLKKTCASLSAYLEQCGANFPHEVLFFHDGPNADIESWAKQNPLFDRVFFNSANQGLSKNINRFWFEESKGRYLMNVEDDWRCDFKDDFISNGIAMLEADENIGCVRFERKYQGDYRRWDEAYKISMRVMSARTFMTPSGHAYRILEQQPNGEGTYSNSCALYRFSTLALVGRLRDDKENRRAQEPEYMRKFNPLWQAARGIEQKDSPFLHIGYGKSVRTWNQ